MPMLFLFVEWLKFGLKSRRHEKRGWLRDTLRKEGLLQEGILRLKTTLPHMVYIYTRFLYRKGSVVDAGDLGLQMSDLRN